jgi:hypothetical protein
MAIELICPQRGLRARASNKDQGGTNGFGRLDGEGQAWRKKQKEERVKEQKEL